MENSQVYNRADQIEQDLIHIGDIFDRSSLIESSDAIERRVYSRIKNASAPFHRKSKDAYQCLNDCIIIEKFASAASQIDFDDDVGIFVSTDGEAYAKSRELDEFHADYANIFDDRHVFFTRSIEQAVDVIRELVIAWEIPRKFRHSNRKSWNEIEAELAVVSEHNWTHWHLAHKKKIAEGKCRIRPGRSLIPLRGPVIGEESWRDELAVANRKLEAHPGLPIATDPYQAGFAEGALTALRWVQGEAPPPSKTMARTTPDQPADRATPTDVPAA